MKQSELMSLIFERPALYLGRPSVELMETYLSGFAIGKVIENPKLEDPLYHNFHDWLTNRFGFGHCHSWSSIIVFMGSGETSSFALAKKLWNVYKAEKEKALTVQ